MSAITIAIIQYVLSFITIFFIVTITAFFLSMAIKSFVNRESLREKVISVAWSIIGLISLPCPVMFMWYVI